MTVKGRAVGRGERVYYLGGRGGGSVIIENVANCIVTTVFFFFLFSYCSPLTERPNVYKPYI